MHTVSRQHVGGKDFRHPSQGTHQASPSVLLKRKEIKLFPQETMISSFGFLQSTLVLLQQNVEGMEDIESMEVMEGMDDVGKTSRTEHSKAPVSSAWNGSK